MIDDSTFLRGIASKATGFLSGFTWKFWLIAIAIVLAAAGAQTVRLSWAQAKIAKMEAAQEKAARKAVERAREADEETNTQRQADTERNTDASNRRKGVIDNAPDDETDAAGRALACERLRAAGIDTPPACN